MLRGCRRERLPRSMKNRGRSGAVGALGRSLRGQAKDHLVLAEGFLKTRILKYRQQRIVVREIDIRYVRYRPTPQQVREQDISNFHRRCCEVQDASLKAFDAVNTCAHQ